MDAGVVMAGVAAAIAVKAGDGLGATAFQGFAEHIAGFELGHREELS
jgi:hypothetical protein